MYVGIYLMWIYLREFLQIFWMELLKDFVGNDSMWTHVSYGEKDSYERSIEFFFPNSVENFQGDLYLMSLVCALFHFVMYNIR